MKLCPDDFQCPYQATFDTLWRLEAIDPGYCEYYYNQPDSKCPHPLSKAFQREVEVGLAGLRPSRADRHFGTNRVMVWPTINQFRHLQGRQYSEVKDNILELSDDKTRFYHRIPPDDPIQPVKEIEVSKEGW